jgi:hypothetical protein
MLTDRDGQFDIVATVTGGGLSGQAGAVRHGLSKALTYYEPELRGVLKKNGFLTRDSRVVERKKFGRARPAGRSSSPSVNRWTYWIQDLKTRRRSGGFFVGPAGFFSRAIGKL